MTLGTLLQVADFNIQAFSPATDLSSSVRDLKVTLLGLQFAPADSLFTSILLLQSHIGCNNPLLCCPLECGAAAGAVWPLDWQSSIQGLHLVAWVLFLHSSKCPGVLGASVSERAGTHVPGMRFAAPGDDAVPGAEGCVLQPPFQNSDGTDGCSCLLSRLLEGVEISCHHQYLHHPRSADTFLILSVLSDLLATVPVTMACKYSSACVLRCVGAAGVYAGFDIYAVHFLILTWV